MNWIISSIIVLKKSVLLGTPTHCTVKPVGYYSSICKKIYVHVYKQDIEAYTLSMDLFRNDAISSSAAICTHLQRHLPSNTATMAIPFAQSILNQSSDALPQLTDRHFIIALDHTQLEVGHA